MEKRWVVGMKVGMKGEAVGRAGGGATPPNHVIYDPPDCHHNRTPFSPLNWRLWCPLGCPLGVPGGVPRGIPWGIPRGGLGGDSRQTAVSETRSSYGGPPGGHPADPPGDTTGASLEG